MRNRFFILLFFVLIGMSTAFAQKVTLNLQKVKLENVLSSITKQTGLTFVYSQPVINPNQIVSVNAKNEEVASVLKRILDDNKVEVEIANKKIYLKPKNQTIQPKGKSGKISGKVLDGKGEAIIGVSILVKGTTNGTITDLDGNFTLADVPSNADLIVSYIGFKSQNIAL
ncbi:MAG: carboxypeptidase-like regulatory domain-containing protein, partial [Porphyromonadaceae bacterium]|nr:carboxypeptidase-like regulatory domain-containing protein [Porphyromonadaceae bacterium]